MSEENFCYWLQGWLEIENPNKITVKQLNEIKNHLRLAMDKNVLDTKFSPPEDWDTRFYC